MQKSTNFKRLERRLERLVGKAIEDYEMIVHGDIILVCLSGGKDSYTLLEILQTLQRRAPISFKLIAMTLDQKQPGFPTHVLPEYLETKRIPFTLIEEDTYSIVKDTVPEGKTMCSLCSRLRRGIIYRVASDLGATKIALGHHREDILETFFLNLMFGGRLKAMPPKLRSDDKRHIVIRPLAYCAENDIARYARAKTFPIIPCNLCGSQDNLQRQSIKAMLDQWERVSPGKKQTIFQSLTRVTPSHLMDTTLYDFASLSATTAAHATGVKYDTIVPAEARSVDV
ncbi:MAG: tRNA 2-thiocytidine(32) synthetase TtcA [Arenicellales bacterium]|nr:tRNA 2-thiocytidine(32) synthetase TtcA [Arenicellales bacterium]